jgi:hypothetical protein
MAGVIYLDTDAIIAAIRAGTEAGNPTGVLETWRAYAQQVGAQIRITDVVLDEVGPTGPGSAGATLTAWMNQNGITGEPTGLIGSIDRTNLGERSILSDIRQQVESAGRPLSDFSIISDNKTQLVNDVNFVKSNLDLSGDTARLSATEFIRNGVMNSSQAMNVSAAPTGMSFDQYDSYRSGYFESSKFNPLGNNYDSSQRFFDAKLYEGAQKALQFSSREGPLKFGGLIFTDNLGGAVQNALSEFTGNVENLKGVLGVLGQAAIFVDFLSSAAQAFSVLQDPNLTPAQRVDGAGLIMSEVAGRLVLGVGGAFIGDAIGATIGAGLAGLASDALLGAIASGVLDGALLGVELGPAGAAVGALVGGIAGALAGAAVGTDLGEKFWHAVNDAAGLLKSAFGQSGSGASLLAPFSRQHLSPPNPRDPLVLDLTGAGIQLTSVTGSPAHFDFAGSGFAAQTGWITSTEGLLVLDNGQGGSTITIDELLGAQSGDGFGDLAGLDSNRDGVIDASDPAFANLKVWRDLNGDGTLADGELVSLASLGITAINLATTASGQQLNGNTVVSTATFTVADGGGGSVTRAMAEVDFATNGLQTQYTPPPGFTYDPAALLLPQLVGYGHVANLSIAMSLDSTLLANVKDLVLDAGSMSGADFDTAFQALVQKWAGASDIDPASHGAFVDARHLAVVYAFYGIDPETQPVYQIDPNWHSGPQWESIYRSIVSELEVRFASQVPLGQLLNGASWSAVESNPLLPFAAIVFNANSDTISVDFNALVQSIVQAAPSDPAAAAAYYEQSFTIVKDLRVDLFGEDNATMAASFAIAAENAGMARGAEATFFSSLGMALVDEGATAGAIGGVPSGAVVYLGTGDKSVSSGTNDIFVYASTGGNDTISNGSSARLAMTNIASTDVTLERPNGGTDLLIVNNATGAVVTVAGQFAGRALVNITFSDGVSYTGGDVSGVLVDEVVRYLESSTDSFAAKQTVLASYGFVSAIDAAGGGMVQGTSADDVFLLGSNATSVSGSDGNDVIASGSGNDILNGGAGNDTYVYTRGDGNDTIIEDVNNGNADRLLCCTASIRPRCRWRATATM